MGETIIEKIIRHNTGKAVKPGDIVTVNVDRVMIHDIFIPFVAEKFEEMGFQKLWDPDRVVLIYDHLVPASQVDDTRHFHVGNAFAERGKRIVPLFVRFVCGIRTRTAYGAYALWYNCQSDSRDEDGT